MGLIPEDHAILNDGKHHTKEFYDKFREKYSDDKEALRQIDLYDPNSESYKESLGLINRLRK